jgi:hypothetical protein
VIIDNDVMLSVKEEGRGMKREAKMRVFSGIL